MQFHNRILNRPAGGKHKKRALNLSKKKLGNPLFMRSTIYEDSPDKISGFYFLRKRKVVGV